VIINGKLIDSRNKQSDQHPHQGARKQPKYFCHWEGCQKSYTKPVRLEEHVRSHTNEVFPLYLRLVNLSQGP
jgi:hypothetical protein